MEAFTRHTRIAFQLSGGKDSVAALYLLRDSWHLFTVYYCDSGDAPQETLDVVGYIAAQVPSFARIQGQVAQVKATYGLPTDLLPWSSAPAAHHHNSGYTPLMQDRVACCSRSVMKPLHDRMVADEVTLIIRGQKAADGFKGRFKSGDVVDGIELLYPVETWSDDMCLEAMMASGVPMPRYYALGLKHSGDCATCTAWCEPGKAAYLAEYHPIKFAAYNRGMREIAAAIAPSLMNFEHELEACHGHAI